jgi:hypothetical protein
MRRNLAFIETLPGFVKHIVFDRTEGDADFNIITVAVWADGNAVAAARKSVNAYYERIGFDMPRAFARLGVTASLGSYRASVAAA